MVKLLKQIKKYATEYGVSLLIGSVIIFGLLAVASSLHTFLELIQFAYMAYLMWEGRHNASNRNIQRSRSAFACA